MKTRHKITAGVAAGLLALGAGFGASAANAVPGNKIHQYSSGCVNYVGDNGVHYKTCGTGAYAYNVRSIKILKGTCKSIGTLWLTKYCAASHVDRYVVLGGGVTYIT